MVYIINVCKYMQIMSNSKIICFNYSILYFKNVRN